MFTMVNKMQLEQFVKNNKVLVASVVILIILIVINAGPYRRSNQTSVGVTTNTTSQLDRANVTDLYAQAKVDSVPNVSSSPEFFLGFPDSSWFNTAFMKVVAEKLGFTSQAAVEGFGTNYIWTEGFKTLSIDTQTGTVLFSTSFNLGDVELPENNPQEAQVQSVATTFLQDINSPMLFFDLENLGTQYMVVDNSGVITPALSGQGPLMQVRIPYAVSGVEVVMPVESYMTVDANGTIRLASLFFPNILQGPGMLDILSWSNAVDKLKRGDAVMISVRNEEQIRKDVPNSDLGILDLTFTESIFGYYVNQQTFYSLGQRRTLTPVYIFENENGRAAVVATNNE